MRWLVQTHDGNDWVTERRCRSQAVAESLASSGFFHENGPVRIEKQPFYFDNLDFRDAGNGRWAFSGTRVDVADDGTETETEFEKTLPTRNALCDRCNGNGVHDHPAFSNGISSEEWNGPDWDDESRENYMSGCYDVTCSECKGEKVVQVPCYEDARRVFGEELYEAFQEYEDDCRRDAADAAAEIKWGY